MSTWATLKPDYLDRGSSRKIRTVRIEQTIVDDVEKKSVQNDWHFKPIYCIQ